MALLGGHHAGGQVCTAVPSFAAFDWRFAVEADGVTASNRFEQIK